MNELTDDLETEESGDIGSLNHSAIQVNLAYLLKRLGTFSVYTELSLDTSSLDKTRYKFREEIKPDVCIYPKRGLSRPYDILKMSEMPLLAIEVVSPKQALQDIGDFKIKAIPMKSLDPLQKALEVERFFAMDIVEKIDAYFALGVRSCWMIDPTTAIVLVYRSLEDKTIFTSGEVIDDVIGIRLPFDDIFDA